MNDTLKLLLDSSQSLRLPKLLEQAEPVVRESYQSISEFLRAYPTSRIYGVNTRVGHQDDAYIHPDQIVEFQDALIQSHAISGMSYYPQDAARTIGFAKAFQIAAGGSTIKPQTYTRLLEAIADRNFKPEIPKSSSYSSGDVIPGAHWSAAFLKYVRERSDSSFMLGPGEAMGLINGSYVHVGYGAHLLRKIDLFFGLLIDRMRFDAQTLSADTRVFNYWHTAEYSLVGSALKFISLNLRQNWKDVQDPVSIRAMPQVLETVIRSATWYTSEVNAQIFHPSGNPLMLSDGAELSVGQIPTPNASFMAPTVSLASSAMIDAVLFSTWANINRSQYLLSGKLENVPRDGGDKTDPIGFIQWPKLMQAMLDEARHSASSRLFSSGGETSYGVEDLWTYGLVSLNQLDKCLETAINILAMGYRVQYEVCRRFGLSANANKALVECCREYTELGDFLFRFKKIGTQIHKEGALASGLSIL